MPQSGSDGEPQDWDPKTQAPAYTPLLAPVDQATAKRMRSLTIGFAVELVALVVLILLIA